MHDLVSQPGGMELGQLLLEKTALVFAEPAGNMQPARRRRGCAAQEAKGVNQDVQSFFRANTGEVADGERRLAPGPFAVTVAFQVQPRVHHVDALAPDAE